MMSAIHSELAISSRSSMFRGRYAEIAERAVQQARSEAPFSIVKKLVSSLELFHASALTWEYLHKHQIHSLSQLRGHAAELDRHVQAGFPELATAQPGIQELLRELPMPEGSDDDWMRTDWRQLIRSFDAVVAECPIDDLERIAHSTPDLAHRARNAYDALRAFVRRHDPARAEVMQIVGEQFQRGNLPLRDAARLLGMSSSDTVFELEQCGFRRSPAAIALDDDGRDAAYQRLRDQRLSRQHPAVVDPDLVDRDVIASERIEGVDARAWMRRR